MNPKRETNHKKGVKKKETYMLVETFAGEILDEDMRFSFVELSQVCNVSVDFIAELVELGSIEPYGSNVQDWRFDVTALQRLKRAVNLQNNLKINPEGISLVLDLLEELNQLRNRVAFLEKQLFENDE